MAAHPVLRMGDPRLGRPADPVTRFPSPELDALVADMWETMEAEGGIGLAAIQIGVPLRVVVFGLAEPEDLEAPAIPRTVLVNPRIEPLPDGLEEGWGGCLSVPGMRGLVPRHRRIVYRGHDPAGAPVEREVEGMHARVVQHECDHLDGILYPWRIRDLADFGFEVELARAGRLTGPMCVD